MNDERTSATRERAGESLMFVSGYVYRLLRYEARKLGIRWTALMVLKDLDLLGALSQKTLAEIEQVREPTMTVLLRQMEDNGWIQRRSGLTDGRIKLATITAKGRRELRRAGRHLQQRLDRVLVELSSSDRKGVETGLGPLVELLMRGISEIRDENREMDSW